MASHPIIEDPGPDESPSPLAGRFGQGILRRRRFSSLRKWKLVGIETHGGQNPGRPSGEGRWKGDSLVKEIRGKRFFQGEAGLELHWYERCPDRSALRPSSHPAILEAQEDPADVLISRGKKRLAELKTKSGGSLEQSSLRRQSQLKHYQPDIEIRALRGNVLARHGKLGQDGFDGIILAAAGIKRMGWTDQVTEPDPLRDLSTCDRPEGDKGSKHEEARLEDP